MSFLSWLTKTPTPSQEEIDRSEARMAAWDAALSADHVPEFVVERLQDAADGRTPWMATMSAAELLLVRRHGIKPVATVSGTCCFHYGYSWTRGHAEGWSRAQARIQNEARLAGAHAVVDVQLRRVSLEQQSSLDYTLVGTAVRIDGLPPTDLPVVATVSAPEFLRLLQADIVPVGIGIGAQYQWLDNSTPAFNAVSYYGNKTYPSLTGSDTWSPNRPLTWLGDFWSSIRRNALAELRRDAARQGSGVLAHTHWGELLKVEPTGGNRPPRFLGRHIVLGTVVDGPRSVAMPHSVRSVVDMRDSSPLTALPAVPQFMNEESGGV